MLLRSLDVDSNNRAVHNLGRIAAVTTVARARNAHGDVVLSSADLGVEMNEAAPVVQVLERYRCSFRELHQLAVVLLVGHHEVGSEVKILYGVLEVGAVGCSR